MIVIANWKQNKTYKDLKEWIDVFNTSVNKAILDKVEVVVSPSYPFIVPFRMIAHEMGYFKVASQDISIFENGAHTGEVGSTQLSSLVEYAIIGHSERRMMGETLDQINIKIENAMRGLIAPIVCFSTIEEFNSVKSKFPSENIIFAYEPASAISSAANSTGPADPKEIKEMVEKVGLKSVIYGGSVDANSLDNYLNLDFISGFLVGSASLDPIKFSEIVNKSA